MVFDCGDPAVLAEFYRAATGWKITYQDGATRPQFQPGDGDWTVLADPAGHVFCLVPITS